MDWPAELERRFKADAAAYVDAVFELATEADTLVTFEVRDGRISFAPDPPPDVVFTFDSADTAQAVVLGEADPVPAFMAGRFRSNGNLPLAFVLLGLFRPDYPAAPPP